MGMTAAITREGPAAMVLSAQTTAESIPPLNPRTRREAPTWSIWKRSQPAISSASEA
jgi:hypothetical protein